MSAEASSPRPQSGFHKKSSILSGKNKFNQKREHFNSTGKTPVHNNPVYTIPVPVFVPRYQQSPEPSRSSQSQMVATTSPEESVIQRFAERLDDNSDEGMGLLVAVDEDRPSNDLTTYEIEESLAKQELEEQQAILGDDNKNGSPKLYDQRNLQQPIYDDTAMQVLNDVAADESFPVLIQYITQLSGLGRTTQARLVARAATFQSKNQVFSNLQNQNDFMKAQDDFQYAGILSTADMTSYDTNADFFTAQALMEASFNIRLLRSRNALNLLQINTQRSESIMGSNPGQQAEESKMRRKIPILGQYL